MLCNKYFTLDEQLNYHVTNDHHLGKCFGCDLYFNLQKQLPRETCLFCLRFRKPPAPQNVEIKTHGSVHEVPKNAEIKRHIENVHGVPFVPNTARKNVHGRMGQINRPLFRNCCEKCNCIFTCQDYLKLHVCNI